MIDIKKCSRCGNTPIIDITLVECLGVQPSHHYVYCIKCDNCKTRTDTTLSRTKAIEQWNNMQKS